MTVSMTGYLAAAGHEQRMLAELGEVRAVHGRLVLADGPLRTSHWSQNLWLDPRYIPITSIADGARKLRAIQRNWWLYPHQFVRRATLLQEALPHVSARPLVFPSPPPTGKLGSWTLLEKDLILASPTCSSPFPHGEVAFEERKQGPPSRAYLKLWEAWTLAGMWPRLGEFCVDLGGSPGGWTWAVAQAGARVFVVDRAPLDGAVAALPGVTFHAGDAFQVKSTDFERVDWLLSDVICYPEKLYEYVRNWIDASPATKMICTLKFQGAEHYGAIDRFAAIPASRIVHLSHNKHELTWMRLP